MYLEKLKLDGRVAVVTGGGQGIGAACARALGEAGATVICTGRSTARADAPTRSDYDRPETIEQTAELVTNLGGVGIPIAVDHLEPAQVAALAERIRGEHGRIDVLVNDIWGAERLKGGPADWNKPIWKLDLQKVKSLLRKPVVADLRNIYRPEEMARLGFSYVSVGRPRIDAAG